MNHIRHRKTQAFLRTTSAFLTGLVVGAAGFAIWGEQAGVLKAGPLFFRVLLPLGTFVGILVAFLPIFVGEIMAAIQKVKDAGRKSREKLNPVAPEPERRTRVGGIAGPDSTSNAPTA